MSDTEPTSVPTGVASTANRFTDDEQLLLTMMPTLVGSAVAFSSKNGAIGTVKEMMANAKAAAAGVQDYPNNEIIRSVIPNFEDRTEAMEAAKAMRQEQVDRLKAAGIASKDDMLAHAVSEAARANELLGAKATEVEANEYREWVLSVADAVANAAKEGGFLGIGGEQVGDGEEETIAKIATAFGR